MQQLPKTLQYPSWIALLLFFVSGFGVSQLSILPTDVLAQDAATDKEYEEAGVVVTALDWEEQEDEYLVWIEFSSIPAYTIYALSNPSRIIVDLENTAFEDHLSFPMQVDIGPIAYIKGREYSTRQPVLARLAVYLQGERPDIEVAEEDYEVLIFIPKPPQAEPEQEETAPEEENQQKEAYQPEETAPKGPESAAGPEVAQEEQKTGDSPKTADQTASLPPEVPKEEPPLSQTAELPTTPLPAEDAAQTASTSAPQEPEIEDKIVEEIIEEKEIDSMELETGKGEVAALPIPDSVPEKPAGKQETENKPALPLPVAATEKKAVATPKKEPVRIILATKKKRAAPKIVPLPQTSPPALVEKKAAPSSPQPERAKALTTQDPTILKQPEPVPQQKTKKIAAKPSFTSKPLDLSSLLFDDKKVTAKKEVKRKRISLSSNNMGLYAPRTYRPVSPPPSPQPRTIRKENRQRIILKPGVVFRIRKQAAVQ